MLQTGRVWFLVADGRRARLLTEERRGAELLQAWVMELGPEDRYEPQDRPPRSHDRVGEGRHAMDKGRSLHEQEEEKFLKRVAQRLVEAEKQGGFEHLALAAPPRALGLLRGMLSQAAIARVRGEIAKDLVDEESDRLRERLSAALR